MIFLALLLCVCTCEGQLSAEQAQSPRLLSDSVSTTTIKAVTKKYAVFDKKITKTAEKLLSKLKKQEAKIYRNLRLKDSSVANDLFSQGRKEVDKYNAGLKQPISAIPRSLRNYLPGLDSLQTSISFLENLNSKLPAVDLQRLNQLHRASEDLKHLQAQIFSATEIGEFVRQRKQLLKQQLESLGFASEVKMISKELYYYQQQLSEYKAMLRDPEKVALKILSIVRTTPAFKDFFSRNSMLASLLPMPNGYGTQQALQGLQTRTAIQGQLTQQLGVSGQTDPSQFLQQQVQQAQVQLSALKDRINQLGGGSSEMEMPDFKPNHQRTKTFWKRLEYGFDLQSQRPNGLLPVTSDIAIMVGYKLNDKALVGVGAGYKLGWGKNLTNIRLTSQGCSLRSYVDIKFKGSIWISGGYEYNYQHEFRNIEILRNLDAWQKSGLIGLTKKYKLGKKVGKMQFLWDFLSYDQIPKTQPIKFRLGYSL